MTEAGPTVHRRLLGQALRGLRESAGLSQASAAAQLGIQTSALSKIENGKQRVFPIQLPSYFRVYRCEDTPEAEQIRQLASLAASGKRSNLLTLYSNVVQSQFAPYLAMEELADKHDGYSWVVPGLLQTEDYARALVKRSHQWRSPKKIKDFVDLRMARQKILHRDNPPQIWTVLDEAALRRVVGRPHVMRKQLERLLEASESTPHLHIQVLPFNFGAHSGIDGPFQILYFPAGPPVVVVESMTSALYLEEVSDVSRYETAINYLRTESLGADASRQFIHNVLKELT
ncbi:helix-turn-helix domain-containing protein [Streptomyces sp. NPDC017448]|uniref:helix-turn-helix domain-containing protein n=1 Tax=Streptomyces sp. NPDC017448 TaxID=3364996 RepID=UPI00378A2475